jgi:hypothetical protein
MILDFILILAVGELQMINSNMRSRSLIVEFDMHTAAFSRDILGHFALSTRG